MRLQSLINAAEAAGYAMAVPEDMLAAEERDLAEFAARNRVILSGGAETTDTGTSSALRRMLAEHSSWMPEWVQSLRRNVTA